MTNYGQLLRTYKNVQANELKYFWGVNPDGTQDYTTIHYDAYELPINSLKSGYQSLLHETKTLMDELRFGYHFKELHGHKVHDDLSNNDPGYSFMQDTRNTTLKDEMNAYCKFLQSLDFKSLKGNNGKPTAKVLQYFKRSRTLLDLIIVLIYMSGGQPPRMSGMEPYQMVNTLEKRNLFWTGDYQFLLIQYYSKNTSQQGIAHNVARYLPHSLSVLLLVYFVYIRPIEMYTLFNHRALSDLVLGDESSAAFSLYLFPTRGGRMSTERLKEAVTRQLYSICKIPLLCPNFRQICTLIAEKHLAETDFPSIGLHPIFHRQAGHSEETAHSHYGITEDDPRLLSRKLLIQYRVASSAWHQFLGMDEFVPSAPVVVRRPKQF